MSQKETVTPDEVRVLKVDPRYDEMGIRWESEEVSVVYGDNQSDKRIVNSAAQIAVITDLDKFRATFGDTFLLAMSDGTSLRVGCQRIGRKFDGKNIEGNRKAVLDYIRGTRSRGTTTRRPLPDGTFYHGTDEVEFRQLYAAKLVDLGTPATLALTISDRLPW